MRIGFDAKRVFFNNTGLGNYSRTLISSLCQFYPANEYYLYTPVVKGKKALNKVPEYSGCHICYPKLAWGRHFGSFWRSFGLARDVESDQIDLYHGVSHEIPYGIEKTKVRSVVTIHDLIYLRYPQLFPFLDRKVYDWKFKHSSFHADQIVAISEQTKQDLIEFFKVPETKIKVVYQACDERFQVAWDEEQLESLRARYFLPNQYVLYVGSLIERKNALNLVKAMHELKLARFEVPLVLVGRGKEYKDKIINYIQEHSLQKQVLILENVTDEDLPGLYQASSLFVYPSIFEGFGIPILEALSSAVPVISSTSCHCFKEAGGPDSVYVDPYDPQALAHAIQGICEDQGKRQKMIESGKCHVEHFQREKIARDMMNVYSSLL